MARRRPPTRRRVVLPSRGPRRSLPAWGCGEKTCWAYEWQPVSAMGDLEAHYRRHHPDIEEEVVSDGHALAA